MAQRIVVHPRIPVFKHSKKAFEEAIASGTLSADPKSALYYERFLYMGTWDGVDRFKNIETRKYLAAH
jgi:hypothetical protein